MPNIKSAKERVKTNKRDQMRNRSVRSSVRSSLKKIDLALEEKNFESAEELYKVASRLVDKAVSKGVLHKNKAARTKSRYYHRIAKSKTE
jgi:small subunit ribosomal protein S20